MLSLLRHALVNRSGSAVVGAVRGAVIPGVSSSAFFQASPFASFASTEAAWTSLFDSPSEWEDLRPVKEAQGNTRLPDFRQKGQVAGGERPPALWIDSKGVPSWVADKLPSLKVEPAKSGGSGAASATSELWQSLFDNPSEWEDVRPIKATGANPRLPDFRKKNTVIGERAPALWIDSKGLPSWVAEKLPSLQVEPAKSRT